MYNIKEFQSKFLSNVEHLNTHNKKFIIGGDININILKNNQSISNYTNDIHSHGCLQIVKSPTRISWKSENSLIDHIYTNLNESRISTETISYDISDHMPNIIFTDHFQLQKPLIEKRIIRDTRNFDINNFTMELNQKLLQTPMNNLSGNEMWNNFEGIFNSTLDNHAPFRLQSRKEAKFNHNPWITKEILKLIKTKQKLFNQAKKDKTKKEPYKIISNKLTHIIQQAKKNHFKTKILQSKDNLGDLWKTVNSIVNIKTTKPKHHIKIQTESGNLETDKRKVSNILNKHFTTIGSKLRNKLTPVSTQCRLSHTSLIKKCNNSFFLNPFTNRDVFNYIKNLNPKKSTRSDCPSIKIIKQCSEIITPIIVNIFNKCISEGVFPTSLKKAEVFPIFKKGNKELASNYRPISILSPFSKLFERHLHNQLTQFLDKNKILYTFQYGFRNNSSTEIALSQICEDLAERIERNSIACSVFVDLAKAFDTVDHQILMSKLNLYGVRGLPGQLISSYLSGRCQVTIANGQKSHSGVITCGVPQGSILGPLLFLLYVNDLPNASSFNIKLFADDACLILDNKDPSKLQHFVNKELVRVNDWMKLNKLSINYEKTNYILFTNKKIKPKINVILEGHTLNQVTDTKYLGVVLNEKLNWKSHINFIKNKLTNTSYLLSKLRHYVDISVLKMVYYSLVYPHLSYCITTWGGAAHSVLNPLILVQKKIIKLITYSSFTSPSTPLFSKLNLLKLQDIYNLNIALLIHKIYNNNTTTGTHNLINISN